MDKNVMWVDASRCTGCGACVNACPVGAIAMVEGKAHIDENSCVGCEACVTACPEDSIHPVITIEGELVSARQRPAPTLYRPGLPAKLAGSVIAVASTGLVMKLTGALARAIARWMARRLSRATPPVTGVSQQPGGMSGQQRRKRQRRRGH